MSWIISQSDNVIILLFSAGIIALLDEPEQQVKVCLINLEFKVFKGVC